MRVLMISYFFPPFNTIGAVRTGKTAKFLTRFGHEVRVISAANQPYQPTLPLEIDPGHVTRTSWFNVNAPVELVLGGRQRVAARGFPTGRSRASLVSTLAQTYKTLFHLPDAQIGWLPYAYRAACRCVDRWRPDVIFASAMPITSLLVARRVGDRYGIPWIAELRDLWVDNTGYAHPSWRRRIERRWQRRTLKSASGIVTVSDTWADRLNRQFARPTAGVMNGFDPVDYPHDDTADSREAKEATSGPLRIIYTGMLYPQHQDPDPLFAAIQGLGPLRKDVRVDFYGRYVATAEAVARKHGIGEEVHVHTAVPYREALAHQRRSDVSLLLLWNDESVRGIYTGKLFEYLGARRPILAVGPDHDEPARLIREREAGVVTRDPAEIAQCLRGWIEKKRAGMRLPDVSPERVADLSRERQTRRLEQFLISQLSSRSTDAAEPRAQRAA